MRPREWITPGSHASRGNLSGVTLCVRPSDAKRRGRCVSARSVGTRVTRTTRRSFPFSLSPFLPLFFCLLPSVPCRADAPPAESLDVQQQEVRAKYAHLQDVLLRMAELTAASDPRRAALLKKAVAQGQERLIDTQFDTLVGLLKEGRLSRAIENQEGVAKDLNALLELLLSENRPDRIRSERARIRDYLKQLNEIINRQKGIQGRTAGTGDAKRLAQEQGGLADKTGGLARQIKANEGAGKGSAGGGPPKPGDQKSGGSGQGKNQQSPDGKGGDDAKGQPGKKSDDGTQEDKSPEGGTAPGGSLGQSQGQNQGGGQSQGQPSQGQGQPSQGQGQPGGSQGQSQPGAPQPAQQRVQAAQQRMREAQEKLEEAQREGAVEKQEEAIRELEQAKAELEEILRQLREEEIERILTMLQERFRRMLAMQEEVNEGTLRLDKVRQTQRDHSHEIQSGRLSSQEAQIVLEADKAMLLLREDGTAVAFPEAVGQMREDMQQVVQRLAQFKVGKITQVIEEDIIAALKEMIDALDKALEDMQESQQAQNQPPGQPQEPPLVDLLAEVKMIRALQMRVNRRTDQYSKLIEGEQATNADLLEALDRLAERQQRIYKVTRDLDLGKNQ